MERKLHCTEFSHLIYGGNRTCIYKITHTIRPVFCRFTKINSILKQSQCVVFQHYPIVRLKFFVSQRIKKLEQTKKYLFSDQKKKI